MTMGSTVKRLIQRAVDLWNMPQAWTRVFRANVTDYTLDGRNVRIQGWEKHPVVQSCARVIIDVVQAVPVEVYTGEADEVKVLPDHPLGILLSNPAPQSPNLPGSRFVGLTALHFLLYGNAFWFIKRSGAQNRGRPSGLKLIHPEFLRSAEYSEVEDRLIFYDWTQPETGLQKRSPAEDIVHFADLTGESWLFGFPRAAAALQDIVSDHEATKYVRQIVSNDGGATLIFHMADGSSREVAEAAEARWQEKRAKRGERGMAAFLSGTLKAEAIGFNLQQLEFPDLRRVTREDICTVFSVDPRMVGIGSAANDGGLSGTQYTEARRRLIAQAVSPLLFALENHINHWLAPEFGEVKVRFSPNGLSELTEDETETSARAIAEYQAGIRTKEEARLMVALPVDMDPSHHVKAGLMGELTVADVETLALPTAQSAVQPPEEQKALPASTRVAQKPEQRAVAWKTFDQLASRHEAPIEAMARRLFREDAKQVVQLFGSLRRDVSDPVLTHGEVELLLRELRRLFGGQGSSVIEWADQMETPIGRALADGTRMVGYSIPLDNPRLAKVTHQRAERLAQHVGQTTAAQVEGAILAGQQAGWGPEQTARMVNQTIFGGLAAQRSTMIARTESVGALNEAGYVGALESGVVQEVEWLTQQDARVRDTHANQDGLRLPMGQFFPNGCRFPGDPVADVGEVVNCRCTLLYH